MRVFKPLGGQAELDQKFSKISSDFLMSVGFTGNERIDFFVNGLLEFREQFDQMNKKAIDLTVSVNTNQTLVDCSVQEVDCGLDKNRRKDFEDHERLEIILFFALNASINDRNRIEDMLFAAFKVFVVNIDRQPVIVSRSKAGGKFNRMIVVKLVVVLLDVEDKSIIGENFHDGSRPISAKLIDLKINRITKDWFGLIKNSSFCH